MPLTEVQSRLAKLLAVNRSPDSHLAGGAALHFAPTSKRYSNDLDYFHDSVERVAGAFAADSDVLQQAGFQLAIEMRQPGYIRALVRGPDGQATKIEWAADSDWRFMPAQKDPLCGYRLHPVDIAVNKVLALAGRDEPRDLVDVVTIHHEQLALGVLCWAAAGKDPGFTPLSLLELLRRRGCIRPEELERLHLAEPIEPTELKASWLAALDSAAEFIRGRPAEELGCLYYDTKQECFVSGDDVARDTVVPHFGRPGGILPRVVAEPS
jgi:hypothetical protein